MFSATDEAALEVIVGVSFIFVTLMAIAFVELRDPSDA